MTHDQGHRLAIATATAGLIALLLLVAHAASGDRRMILLVLIGAAIGIVLLATNFGFAAAFRSATVQGDLTTFRAHALMLMLGSAGMVPIIAAGTLFGQPMAGFATPLGLSFLLGAALFGAGMQLAGGCASGTLFLLGGGNLRYGAVLLFFVAGSAIGAAHMDFWRGLPAMSPVTVFSLAPWPLALAAEIGLLGAVWRWLPRAGPLPPRLLVGAAGLAALNIATLITIGRPWSETFGFALWGSKIAGAIGFDPKSWGFWGDGAALDHSLFADQTSIMDLSILLGALLAAGLTRRFRLTLGGGRANWAAAACGGLMMGYGARLADGCNIGAYFSAIASGSFSGYVWCLMAMLGSVAGAAARRLLDRLNTAAAPAIQRHSL